MTEKNIKSENDIDIEQALARNLVVLKRADAPRGVVALYDENGNISELRFEVTKDLFDSLPGSMSKDELIELYQELIKKD